uniref:Uncharacterized protein n=1 Tax=Palpitomonas bilix TaxID=652834 RepID=A0A7S3D888_9EUKA|mmetsp:Transcript_26529/g.68013  ORF Transcript_26529/g.68013 Transcript_26529/m.68013 type:complete len:1153 (+) Transcript_26529:114-3572(+)
MGCGASKQVGRSLGGERHVATSDSFPGQISEGNPPNDRVEVVEADRSTDDNRVERRGSDLKKLSESLLRQKLGLGEGANDVPEIAAHLVFSLLGGTQPSPIHSEARRSYAVEGVVPSSNSLHVSWTFPKNSGAAHGANMYVLEMMNESNVEVEDEEEKPSPGGSRVFSMGTLGPRRVYEGETCSCVVSHIQRGKKYDFRLIGVDDGGKAIWISNSEFVCAPDVPSAPPIPKLVEKAARRALLQFFLGEANGAAITQLSVSRTNVLQEDDTFMETIPMTGSPKKRSRSRSVEVEMDDLNPNSSYKVCARCTNKVGDGQWSQPLFVVTNPDVPSKVFGLVVKSVGRTHAALSWIQPTSNGRDVLKYEVEVLKQLPKSASREMLSDAVLHDGTSAYVVDVKMNVHVHMMGAPTDFSLEELDSAGNYGVRVAGTNAIGRGEWSEPVFFKTTAGAPNPPTTVTVAHVSSNDAKVQWKSPMSNGSPVSQYRLKLLLVGPIANSGVSEEEGDSEGEDSHWNIVYEGSLPEAKLSGLRPACRYLAVVEGKNEIGWGAPSRECEVVTHADVPLAPPNLEVKNVSDNTAFVVWGEADCRGGDLEEYVLEMCAVDEENGSSITVDDVTHSRSARKEEGGEAVQEHEDGFKQVYRGMERSYQVFHLRPGAQYAFRVFASNSIGFSPSSSIVIVKTHQNKALCDIRYADLKFGDVLGEGAFSIVYEGEWLGRKVAIKKLKDGDMTDDGQKKFKKEITLLSRLEHANIVKYIGACFEPPNLCVITELLTRGSLSELLYKKKVKFGLGLALRLAKNIAEGCHYLHSLRPIIIHRDLKSSNILVDEHWNAKIADFGLSKFKSDASHTSGALGTPGWTAPEIYRNEKYDESVDAYSFGIILKEIMTGERPYPNLNAMQIAFATVYKGVRPDVPDSLPVFLKNLMKSCWDTDPSRRPKFKRILQTLSKFEATVAKSQVGRKLQGNDSFESIENGDEEGDGRKMHKKAGDLKKLSRVSPRRMRQQRRSEEEGDRSGDKKYDVRDDRYAHHHHHHHVRTGRPSGDGGGDEGITHFGTGKPSAGVTVVPATRPDESGHEGTPGGGGKRRDDVDGDVLRNSPSVPVRDSMLEGEALGGDSSKRPPRRGSPPPSRLRARVPSAARVRRSTEDGLE